MERFFKRKLSTDSPSPSNPGSSNARPIEVDEILANLQADPGLRTRMADYSPNIRDEIRRAYLQKGPCQPRSYKFPQTNQSGINRRFIANWFDDHDWLEYSIAKDAAFCFHCYLFKSNFDQVGGDAFTGVGFNNWKKAKERFNLHVGPVGSVHNQAREVAYNLMHQTTHIETIVIKQTSQARTAYRTCLNASLKCTRYLLRQGLSFRGHDESAQSSNRGNYLELLQFLANHDEKVKAVVLENAPGNLKLIAPSIQKDLEQMAMVLRYVNDKGQIIERFVGVQYVTDTTSSALKEAIDEFFSSANLSFSKLRRQGYDGASNMRGEFNGLKTKILREQPCAFYVHCFAHQLQLALVAVAKKNIDVNSFFTTANSLVNVVGASCKRRDALRAQYQEELVRAFEEDCLIMGRDLNQETTLKRAGDTRWNSHYVPTMDEEYVIPGRSRRNAPMKTNYHHYCVEMFIHVIDGQLVELNDRFNENFYAKPPWPHNPGSATAHCPIHSCSLSGSMHLMITCLHLGITKPKHPTDGTLRYPLPKALLTTISELEPTCFSQASKSHKWRSAMSKEINALLKNNTWSLVPPSPHHNTVGSKWVFRIKRKPDGSIERYKACLVAKGFHQQLGIDYGETFNPIVKPTTIRTILSVAISRGWPLRQLDVKNAFLHGFLQEDVYMIQPPVFIDPDRPNYVYKLHKSLYGLKQAPRAWFHRISSFLITIGFTQILPHGDSLHINQLKYAHDLLQKHNLEHCKSVTTPIAAKVVLSNTDGPLLPSQTEFCELVGCLQYLTLTRPNIAYAVNTVSQFMNASRAPHLVAAKRILQYVKRTVDHGLVFRPQTRTARLCAYSNVDWAGCPDTRRSTSDYLIYLGSNLVSWCSKK
ncbi:unnamed protein product [Prunus armeniaca]